MSDKSKEDFKLERWIRHEERTLGNKWYAIGRIDLLIISISDVTSGWKREISVLIQLACQSASFEPREPITRWSFIYELILRGS